MEITWNLWKFGLLWTVKPKNTFSKSLLLSSIGVSHISSVIKPATLKVWKTFPKRLLIKKLDFCIKKYFFPNKRKNFNPFRTDVPIRSHSLRTPGAGAARIKKSWNQWEHWYWYQIGYIVRGYKYVIKAIHSQSLIVNSDQLQLKLQLQLKAIFLDVFSFFGAYTFDVSFLSFVIFRTVSRGCFGKKFCTFKILFE